MKHKYDKKLVVDVVGILYLNEDGELVVFVDEVPYDFTELAKSAIGTEIHFKSEMIEA